MTTPHARGVALSELLRTLEDGQRPSLEWVLRHAPRGDLQELWDAEKDAAVLYRLLTLAGLDPPYPVGKDTRRVVDLGGRIIGWTQELPDPRDPDWLAQIRRAYPHPPTLSDLLARVIARAGAAHG